MLPDVSGGASPSAQSACYAAAHPDRSQELMLQMEDWILLHETESYDAETFTVVSMGLQSPEGLVLKRHIVKHPGTVAIVAVDHRSRIALVRPFRPAFKMARWEIPAGHVDTHSGETLMSLAVRELEEEVGVRAEVLVPVLSFANAPGHSDHVTTVFRANGLRKTKPKPVGPEENGMEVCWCTPAEAMDRIARDGPADAKSLIALGCATPSR